MRKKAVLVVCFVFLLFISGFLSAQDFKIGLKAGTSFPNLKSDGSNEISSGYESKVAGNFGLVADIGLSKKLALRTGFDYAGQGGIRNGQQPVTKLPTQFAQMVPPGQYIYANFNNESTLNYLEVPVMCKYELGNKIKYYLNAGPYVGFLLGAEQKTAGNSTFYLDKSGAVPLTIQGQPLPSQSFDATTKIDDDIRSTNYGLTGGVGLALGINEKSSLLLDARAAYGLRSIQKNIAVNGNSKTGGLFFTLGYMFSL